MLWWLMNTVGIEEAPVAELVSGHTAGLLIEDSLSEKKHEAKAAHAETSHEDADSEEEPAGESHEGQASDAKASGGHDAPKSDESKVFSDKPSHLSISSEPSGVNVFLNGSKVGVTPLERTLTPSVQKFRFEKEGFVPVEREAPAEPVPEGAYLSWRISMVTQQLPPAEKSRIDSEESYFLKGMTGPVFVQVKSYSSDLEPRSGVIRKIQSMRESIREEKIFACEVSLGDKGQWYRILIGPFATREEAGRSNTFLKESLKVDDLFVTGAQSCL